MKKYLVLVLWDDDNEKKEYTDDFKLALGAVQIYIEDPHITAMRIIDCDAEHIVLDWRRQ